MPAVRQGRVDSSDLPALIVIPIPLLPDLPVIQLPAISFQNFPVNIHQHEKPCHQIDDLQGNIIIKEKDCKSGSKPRETDSSPASTVFCADALYRVFPTPFRRNRYSHIIDTVLQSRTAAHRIGKGCKHKQHCPHHNYHKHHSVHAPSLYCRTSCCRS